MGYKNNTKTKDQTFQVSKKPQIVWLQIVQLPEIWCLTWICPFLHPGLHLGSHLHPAILPQFYSLSQPATPTRGPTLPRPFHPPPPLPPSSPPCSRAGPERSMGDLNVRNHIVGVLLMRGHVTHPRPRCARFTLLLHKITHECFQSDSCYCQLPFTAIEITKVSHRNKWSWAIFDLRAHVSTVHRLPLGQSLVLKVS